MICSADRLALRVKRIEVLVEALFGRLARVMAHRIGARRSITMRAVGVLTFSCTAAASPDALTGSACLRDIDRGELLWERV
jgi:hypothetical protein